MFNRFSKIVLIASIFFAGIFVFNNTQDVQAQGNCPAPLCIDNVQSNPTTNSATITWTTNIPATSQIEYWLNSRNPTPKISVRTSPATSHSITIPTGGSLALNPNFTYGFKITVNASGFSPSTFTNQFGTQAPTSSCSDPVCISGVAVGNVTQTSAVVTWTTNVPAKSQVNYNTTPNFSTGSTRHTSVSSSLTTSHSVTVSDLNPGSTYYVQAVSESSDGSFTARSRDNNQFTTQTPGCASDDPVCVTNLRAAPTANGATITWTTRVPATSQVRYNTRPTFTTGETRSTPVNNNKTTSHSVTISGLNSGTTYYVQAISSDGSYTARSSALQFRVGGVIGGDGCGTPGQPACPPPAPGGTQTFRFRLDNPLEADNFLELIDVIATWLFNLAIPVVVVMIVYAGVMFLTSRGEPARVTKARQILLYAVVGFAIILIGKGFITLIESVLNLGS